MPRIVELIDCVGKSNYVSTMDLARLLAGTSGTPGQKENGFFGLFQFNVMPFGLKGAPATFRRLMDHVGQGLDFAGPYLDMTRLFTVLLNCIQQA